MIKRLLLLACVLLYGCDGNSNPSGTKTISASACAKAMSDGTVVDCEPTADGQQQLKLMHEKLMRIDVEFPGPKGPNITKFKKEELHDVVGITQKGDIKLAGGEILALAGMKCDQQDLAKNLRAIFIRKKPSKVFYRPSGFKTDQRIYAYVWDVDTHFGDSNPMFGPMISPTNETALSSGWCKPIAQDKHIYLERYKRIATIAN